MKQILFVLLSLVFTSSYSQSVRVIADSMNIKISDTKLIVSDSLLAVDGSNVLIQVGIDDISNQKCLDTYDNIKEQATAKYGEPYVLVSNTNYERVKFWCGVNYLYLQLSYDAGQFTFIMYTN